MKKISIYIVTVFCLFACSSSTTTQVPKEVKTKEKALNFLALGDSYTIGEMVKEEERWPEQLREVLASEGLTFNKPVYIAKTGWRTDELLKEMSSYSHEYKYDLISIQIGVNNQYQKKEISQFREDLQVIVKEASVLAKKGAKSIMLISIPDYSVTPFIRSNREEIASELKKYNAIILETAKMFDVKYVNITEISLSAGSNTSLVANDKLHPSGIQYKAWVKYINETAYKLLKEQ